MAAFILESIQYARIITNEPLLLRADSGNDVGDNLKTCLLNDDDFIIKRNPRREKPELWFNMAEQMGELIFQNEEKRTYEHSINVKIPTDQKDFFVRQVVRVTERMMDKNGQLYLVPDYEYESYWTTLDCDVKEIIDLYHDHATCEQFHSELKTDLDLERFPSGKFKTNQLILLLGASLIIFYVLQGRQVYM